MAKLTLFADYTHRYVEAENTITLIKTPKRKSTKSNTGWMQTKKSLNPVITQLLLINPSTKNLGYFKLHIGKNDIEVRNKAEYLGVHTDNTLSWNAHIQFPYKKNSAKQLYK